jgi:hypothetical protein
MKFDFQQVVGGRPLAYAREFLRKRDTFTVVSAADMLDSNEFEAAKYLSVLEEAGFLQQEDDATYALTRLGVHLSKAKMAARFSRADADEAIGRLVTAIERVNADPKLLMWVDEADLFGGYVDGAEDLGDVDVAVSLVRRLPGPEWVEASQQRARQSGKARNFVQALTWGEEEVWRALRASSRRLDLQPKDDIAGLGCSMKPIYRRSPVGR